MKITNLAGDFRCDATIRSELGRCRIKAHQVDRVDGEVPYTVTGRATATAFVAHGTAPLFIFTRAWRYWVVRGPFPLHFATSLYESEPAWRDDVRAGGHCCAEHPAEHATHYDFYGKQIGTRADEASFKSIIEAGADPTGVMADAMKKWVFEDDPASAAGYSLVEFFHIDSELGLRLFAQAIGYRT